MATIFTQKGQKMHILQFCTRYSDIFYVYDVVRGSPQAIAIKSGTPFGVVELK